MGSYERSSWHASAHTKRHNMDRGEPFVAPGNDAADRQNDVADRERICSCEAGCGSVCTVFKGGKDVLVYVCKTMLSNFSMTHCVPTVPDKRETMRRRGFVGATCSLCMLLGVAELVLTAYSSFENDYEHFMPRIVFMFLVGLFTVILISIDFRMDSNIPCIGTAWKVRLLLEACMIAYMILVFHDCINDWGKGWTHWRSLVSAFISFLMFAIISVVPFYWRAADTDHWNNHGKSVRIICCQIYAWEMLDAILLLIASLTTKDLSIDDDGFHTVTKGLEVMFYITLFGIALLGFFLMDDPQMPSIQSVGRVVVALNLVSSVPSFILMAIAVDKAHGKSMLILIQSLTELVAKSYVVMRGLIIGFRCMSKEENYCEEFDYPGPLTGDAEAPAAEGPYDRAADDGPNVWAN